MKNKWLIALSAVGIHICIGSVYAWSVLTRPIMSSMGFTQKEVTWIFSIAILFLGLSAGFLGDFVEKHGPRKSGLAAAAFFGTGMLGSALALHLHSLALLYLFYGVIGGIGLGIGYITPVSTLVKWFPKNRGFATGLAIMGFGFAALIAGPLMQYLVANFGLVANFLFLGCVYIALISASALYLAPPPEAWLRANGLPVAAHGGKDGAGSGPDVARRTAGQAAEEAARPVPLPACRRRPRNWRTILDWHGGCPVSTPFRRRKPCRRGIFTPCGGFSSSTSPAASPSWPWPRLWARKWSV